jgi:hypothetical protein
VGVHDLAAAQRLGAHAQAPRELAEVIRGQQHAPEGVQEGAIKAARDDYELGLEGAQRRLHDGVKGRRVHKKSELKEAIQEMLDHDGPYVLDVIVPYTEHVLPMIPAGKTVKDMLLK